MDGPVIAWMAAVGGRLVKRPTAAGRDGRLLAGRREFLPSQVSAP